MNGEKHGEVELTEAEWQNLGSRFVAEHVLCNVGSMVEFILIWHDEDTNAPFSWDDAENWNGPHGIEDWEPSQCIAWLQEQGIDLYDTTDELKDMVEAMMEDPETPVEIAAEELGIADWMLPDWVIKGTPVSGMTSGDIQQMLINCIDEWSDTRGGWREAVELAWEEARGEVFEWWAVSSDFGRELIEIGEIVIEQWGFAIWGRCGTGQAIKMDQQLRPIFAKWIKRYE